MTYWAGPCLSIWHQRHTLWELTPLESVQDNQIWYKVTLKNCTLGTQAFATKPVHLKFNGQRKKFQSIYQNGYPSFTLPVEFHHRLNPWEQFLQFTFIILRYNITNYFHIMRNIVPPNSDHRATCDLCHNVKRQGIERGQTY